MNRNNLISAVLIAFSSLISGDVYSVEGEVQTSKHLYVNEDSRDKYWLKLRELDPKYPALELKLKKSACVTVMFTIDKKGNVLKPSVAAIFPEENAHFENISVRTMKKFKYKPSDTNVERKEIITTHTFNFVIAEGTKRAYEKIWAELEQDFEDVCRVEFTLKK